MAGLSRKQLKCRTSKNLFRIAGKNIYYRGQGKSGIVVKLNAVDQSVFSFGKTGTVRLKCWKNRLDCYRFENREEISI
jgi:hypothetical protein